MKICYFGDAESIHVQRWCKHFSANGHEVSLISFKNKAIEGIDFYFVDAGNIAVSGGNWKVLLKSRSVKKLLKKIKPDVFHSFYATSYGITGALANYHPYVITTLGSDVLISPQNSKVYRTLLRFAFRRADWITSMADHMKKAIEAMGVQTQKITTVPFGIDPDIFNESNRSLATDHFVITSTRNLEPVYNIEQLIKAFAKAQQEIPNARLRLIGDGSLRKELEKSCEDLGILEQVSFMGKVSQKEIADTLRQSHVFVTVSRSDGNNISLNEAMACGVWSIASNIPANTQWITDGSNGFLVALDDVSDLAEKLVTSWRNYEQLQTTAVPINREIISTRALWSVQMQRVLDHYHILSKKA